MVFTTRRQCRGENKLILVKLQHLGMILFGLQSGWVTSQYHNPRYISNLAVVHRSSCKESNLHFIVKWFYWRLLPFALNCYIVYPPLIHLFKLLFVKQISVVRDEQRGRRIIAYLFCHFCEVLYDLIVMLIDCKC